MLADAAEASSLGTGDEGSSSKTVGKTFVPAAEGGGMGERRAGEGRPHRDTLNRSIVTAGERSRSWRPRYRSGTHLGSLLRATSLQQLIYTSLRLQSHFWLLRVSFVWDFDTLHRLSDALHEQIALMRALTVLLGILDVPTQTWWFALCTTRRKESEEVDELNREPRPIRLPTCRPCSFPSTSSQSLISGFERNSLHKLTGTDERCKGLFSHSARLLYASR